MISKTTQIYHFPLPWSGQSLFVLQEDEYKLALSNHFKLNSNSIIHINEESPIHGYQDFNRLNKPKNYIIYKSDIENILKVISEWVGSKGYYFPEKIENAEEFMIPVEDIFDDETVLKSKSSDKIIHPVEEEIPEEENTIKGDISAEEVIPQFSIRLKMIGVLTLLISITVSVIIGFATFYFKNDNEVRIRENNIRLADLIGQKVKADIEGLIEKGQNILKVGLDKRIEKNDRETFYQYLLENDPDFLFLGIYTADSAMKPVESFFNDKLMTEQAVSQESIETAIRKSKDVLFKAISGEPVIVNTSLGFSIPNFVIAFKGEDGTGAPIIISMMIRLEKISGVFSKSGIYTTYFVNQDGNIISHPNEEFIIQNKSMLDVPIVKEMLSSPVKNGQVSYKDKDGEGYLASFKKIGIGNSGIIVTVLESKAFQEVYNIQERNLYIMGISLFSTLIVVFLFARTLTEPLIGLLFATVKIAKGDFKLKIKPSTKDEIGLLTSYFINMSKGLEEREKVKNILGSMIDPTVVKEAMVDLAALKRGSEKQITSFFSDVAGFSGISEKLSSVDLAALLNEYLSAMTIILKQYEGTLDKYIGDAIVGIFNAPIDVSDHPLKSAKCAVDMINKLKEMKKNWSDKNAYIKEAQEMSIRIGLNFGNAKVGFMGTDNLASYTMMGDTVNLAARLEAAAKDYGVYILISETVNDKIQSEMRTRFLDLVRVKGKYEPVRIYELVDYKDKVGKNLDSSIQIYEQAMQEYLKRNFKEAIDLFEKSESVRGSEDKAVHMLTERCLEYIVDRPPIDWDGAFTRTHK